MSSPRVLLIGAGGTIGKEVKKALEAAGATVVPVSRSGEVKVDLNDVKTVKAMYESAGKIDHVVMCAGVGGYFGPLAGATTEQYLSNAKLTASVAVVLEGVNGGYVSTGGSITLTSGCLTITPCPGLSALSMLNSAINGFVVGANTELAPKGIRLNVVSPPLVTESVPMYGPFFKGLGHLPAATVAQAYVRTVFSGGLAGQVIELEPAGYSPK